MNKRDFQRRCWDYQQKLIASADFDDGEGIGDAEQSLEDVISEFQLEVLWSEAGGVEVIAETAGEERVGLLYDASGPMVCWLDERLFVVVWDNGHASGELGRFASQTDALEAGNDWISEMLAIDENPDEAEYSFAVYQHGCEEPVAERGCPLGED